jgi:mediator of RNA polymerase II transcription subunit 22
MTTMTTMTAQEAQLKAYHKRLRDDIKSIVDNFVEILRLVRVETESNQTYCTVQSKTYEMCCRAANMTRAADSLLKLIWDIKQFLIINDFPLINESISNRVEANIYKVNEIDHKLLNLRDEISVELYELEDEFYNSLIK